VTVSIGWFDKDYAAHRVIVEGAPLFDSVGTTPPSRTASPASTSRSPTAT
jgi:hypothetical protein